MKPCLRILILEDVANDAALVERVLRRGGLEFEALRVETQEEFVGALDSFAPGLILADYNLPSFDGLRALEIVRATSASLPFVLVSGHIGEDSATEALKMGATDFVLKSRLARLLPCIQRALREADERAEHRRLAERFRLFVEAAPNAMVMMDADGAIELVNGQTEQLFGYSRAEMLGQSIELLMPERFRGMHVGLRARFRAGGRPRQMGEHHEILGMRRDGGEFPADVGLNPIDTPEGIAVLAVVVDISARRRLEREKEEQRQELERSNADLQEFAYVASHDLKAPLRAIAHLAQWIGDDIAPVATPEMSENLALLQGRVARLTRLLDGLLDYSRLGRVNSPVEDVDVAELVRDIVAMLVPPRGFAVLWEGETSVLRTRRMAIQVVLENLIGNALKHHDRTSGRIAVAMRMVDGVAEFRVSDDGPGITPRFHERIFVIFQTLASRDDVESSGIGLAIVKRKIESNGGRIWVESAPPARGTTFAFTWREAEA